VESATQTLHRLTSIASYEPGREWEVPVEDPHVCVGVPDYASAAGGLPGALTGVRTVSPRNDVD
jgi:hypothetical protein